MAEGKIPHGYKRCPKCEGLVKGPRTKVCGECNHEFVKGGTPSKVKVKVKTKSKPVAAVTVDPYTFSENVHLTGNPPKGAIVIRRAAGILNNPGGDRKVTEMLESLSDPGQPPFPAIVEFA